MVPESREDAIAAFGDGGGVTVLAGGTILMPKMEIPNTGWMGLFQDPTGNVVGLFKSK